jgi:hypothetical protein
MISQLQREGLGGVARLLELSAPDMRLGQMFAILGFLAEGYEYPNLWDIEDADLLKVIEIHLGELRQLQQARAEAGVTATPP